jgi:hypothetical protein
MRRIKITETQYEFIRSEIKKERKLINESTLKSIGYNIAKIVAEQFYLIYYNYFLKEYLDKHNFMTARGDEPKNIIQNNNTIVALLDTEMLEYEEQYNDYSLTKKYTDVFFYPIMRKFLENKKLRFGFVLTSKVTTDIFEIVPKENYPRPLAIEYDKNQEVVVKDDLSKVKLEALYNSAKRIILISFPKYAAYRFTDFKDVIIRTATHELQHAFDDFISQGKFDENSDFYKYKEKYKGKEMSKEQLSDYFKLPFEINARISELIKSIDFSKYDNFNSLMLNNLDTINNFNLSKGVVGEKTYKRVLNKLYISFNYNKIKDNIYDVISRTDFSKYNDLDELKSDIGNILKSNNLDWKAVGEPQAKEIIKLFEQIFIEGKINNLSRREINEFIFDDSKLEDFNTFYESIKNKIEKELNIDFKKLETSFVSRLRLILFNKFKEKIKRENK